MVFTGEVEEEIDALYQNVPEISSHFTILEKIGEGIVDELTYACDGAIKIECYKGYDAH